MEVWKIVFHSILEIFYSILASSIFHTEISVPFDSIFHSIRYYTLITNYGHVKDILLEIGLLKK